VNGTELCKCADPCCLSPDFGLVRLELLATDNRSLELLATDNRSLELRATDNRSLELLAIDNRALDRQSGP
jgi:hypothetical protein